MCPWPHPARRARRAGSPGPVVRSVVRWMPVVGGQLAYGRRYSRPVPSTNPASFRSWIMRSLSSDIVIPFPQKVSGELRPTRPEISPYHAPQRSCPSRPKSNRYFCTKRRPEITSYKKRKLAKNAKRNRSSAFFTTGCLCQPRSNVFQNLIHSAAPYFPHFTGVCAGLPPIPHHEAYHKLLRNRSLRT